MPMKLKSTKDVAASKITVLVYGASGAGKTTLIKTLGNGVIIISAEAGLLSLKGTDIPVIEVHTYSDLIEAFNYVLENRGSYKTVVLDSISEIAEVVLQAEKDKAKDARLAYGNLSDLMSNMIRMFRDLPDLNVYFTAKLEKSQDETGRMMFFPSAPGSKVPQYLPYFFDEVFALRVEKDSEGKVIRMLQTGTDGVYTAKDRSGVLDMYEQPDLGAIFAKIAGGSHD